MQVLIYNYTIFQRNITKNQVKTTPVVISFLISFLYACLGSDANVFNQLWHSYLLSTGCVIIIVAMVAHLPHDSGDWVDLWC